MTLELLAAYRLVAADIKHRIERAVAERKPRWYVRNLETAYGFVSGMAWPGRGES